jgi:nucleotide-binding universal stress UspA family protein
MVAMDRGSSSAGRARLAARLADRVDARLIGLAARMPDYFPMDAGYVVPSGFTIEDSRTAALDELAASEKIFREAAGWRERVEWRSGLKDPAIFLEEQSRAADLVVIGRDGGSDLLDLRMTFSTGIALMSLGRPVLVVPPGIDGVSGSRIVVAWKSTLQTRRAISDAMPLLRLADGVQVVTISEDDDRKEIVDVAHHLGLHGVKASALRRGPSGDSVAVSIQDAAEAFGADLIVSGAYGHNRVREWLFGGVTRALLDHSQICCLMSH